MEVAHKDIYMSSVIDGNFDNFRYIFDRYPLISDDTFFDYDLLKAALTRSHKAIAIFLLDAGCRILSKYEETPLIHLAINMDDVEIVKKMLIIGISIYDKNCEGDTPVYVAFKEKRYAMVDEILNHFYGPIDVIVEQHRHHHHHHHHQQLKFGSLDPLNNDDTRHFHIACIRNNLDVVELFLNFGFDVNEPFSLHCSWELSQFNPIYYAAIIQQNFYMLQSLLQHGADLSIRYNSNRNSSSNSKSNNNSDSDNSNGKGQTLLHAIYYTDVDDMPRRISRVFDYANDSVFINCVDDNDVSHFHLCCMTNNPHNVKKFMDKGAVDINTRTSSSCSPNPGFTPLHFAVEYDCVNVIPLLLENGADCHKVDENGNTPLHVACAKIGNRLFVIQDQIILMLLDYGSRPDAINNLRVTPLHQAFYNDCINDNVIGAMLSKVPRKVNNNVTDSAGVSFFHIACARNDTGWVNDFIESGEAVDIDTRAVSGEYRGWTALHFATSKSQKDIVEILLKSHARVNIPTALCRSTPLHLTCNLIRILLGRKNDGLRNKDDNDDDKYPSAAANFDSLLAGRNSHFDIIKLLILYEADVEAKDLFENTPLLAVCEIDGDYCLASCLPYSSHDLNREIDIRQKGIFEILLSEGRANLNARSLGGESILHIVCHNHLTQNSNELMEFLINKGADINAADDAGLRPLHIAVINKAIESIKILVKYKADVNSKSNEGKSPLHFLIELFLESHDERELENILSILLENGSDVNAKYVNLQHRERTPWLDAAARNQTFLFQQLIDYGADINMEDSFGCPFSLYLFFEWKYVGLYPTTAAENNIFRVIFIHVKRMLAAGFYVNNQVVKFYLRSYEFSKGIFLENSDYEYLEKLDNVCLEELNRIKHVKIDNYASLFDILRSDAHKLSKRIKNRALLKIINDPNICANFPLYGCFIKMRFKKGLERRNALQFANSSLRKVMNYHNLPDLCCDSILVHLTNEEIGNLNAAVRTYSLKE